MKTDYRHSFNFNEPQRLYQGVPGRTQDIIYNFITVTLGVSGRF